MESIDSTNPYSPPTPEGLAVKPRQKYSVRQWGRAVMVFAVVTPAACAVTTFFVLISGAIILGLLSQWIELGDFHYRIAFWGGLLFGGLLGIRAGVKTARDTFPLGDFTSATINDTA